MQEVAEYLAIFPLIGAAIAAGGGLLASKMAGDRAEEAGEKNAALQREFAQSGIQWKVADAKKAGVHPLYALGAQTIAASPAYIPGDSSGIADAAQSIGQGVSQAAERASTAPGRVDKRMAELALTRAELENDLLRSQISRNVATSSPAIPMATDPFAMPGQADSGLSKSAISDIALQRIRAAHGAPFSEPGPVTDVGFTRTHTGGLAPVYSKDAKERLEDDYLGMLAWNIRNRFIPSMTLGATGPRPPGHRGFYDPVMQEWVSWK